MSFLDSRRCYRFRFPSRDSLARRASGSLAVLRSSRTAGPGARDADLAEDARVEIGAELGRLLAVLHAPETVARIDPERALPVDFNRRADMAFRVPRTRERLAEFGWSETAEIAELLAEAEALPASSGHVLVHVISTSGTSSSRAPR
jgi:hypothetical protein